MRFNVRANPICRPRKCALFGVLASMFVAPIGHCAEDSTSVEPVIVFIHGRGQSDKTEEDVRARFVNSFVAGQKSVYGTIVVPESQTRFVWYADVIDDGGAKSPPSSNCRFASEATLPARFKDELRESLIHAAQALNLDDAGLNLLAGDTYKYLTKPAVRCEADTRLTDALFAKADLRSPKIVVAHSMGGIVAFSAIERLSTTPGLAERPSIPRLITMGTQVGLPEVLKGLEGDLVKPPVPLPNLILGWSNFHNRGDRLAILTEGRFIATDPLRAPRDSEIRGNGSAHAIETYLGNKDVVVAIVTAWCDAHGTSRPRQCPTNAVAQASKALPETAGLGAMAVNLAFFFDVKESAVRTVRGNGSRVQQYGADSVVVLDVDEVAEHRRTAKFSNFSDAFFFYLAHEFAHIAQQNRAPALFQKEPSLVVECNADLWAGIAFVMAQPLDPANASERAKHIIALSAEGGDLFPIGVHLSDKVASHPEALQRASCTANGISAGLVMFRKRQIAAARANGFAIAPAPPADDEYADLENDPWQWSINTARRIGDYEASEGAKPMITWGPVEFTSLATAAEAGPARLAASGVLRSSIPASPVCTYVAAGKSTSAECLSPPGISERLTFVAYDSTIGMLRPLLLSRGWTRESAIRSNQGVSESFAYKRAHCTASADFSSQTVWIKFVTEE